ncbi:MAG: EamA family transporter, partial [Cyanobacteria bacterium P01_H01_bin.130]
KFVYFLARRLVGFFLWHYPGIAGIWGWSVTAADNESPTGSTESMMDDAALTEDELQLLDEWMTEPVVPDESAESADSEGAIAPPDNLDPPDNLPDPESEESRSRSPLQDLTQDLRNLQHALLLQLTDDVQRLGAEKAKLAIDIDRLQLYRQRLQEQQQDEETGAIAEGRRIEAAIDPNAREWAQRWAQQLAQHMGQYLNEALRQRFDQIEERFEERLDSQIDSQAPYPVTSDGETAIARDLPPDGEALDLGTLESTDQMLASLDYRVHTVLQGLQRDLDTYESELVQQLQRMHTLQQQGELVLQSLIHRLEEAWVRDAEAQENRSLNNPNPFQDPSQPLPDPLPPRSPLGEDDTSLEECTDPVPTQAIVPVPSSDRLLSGLGLGMLSVVTLTLFNAALRVLFQGTSNVWWLGGSPVSAILPPTGGNVLLVLALRTLTVLLIFPIVAKLIYPPIWSDLQQLFQASSPPTTAPNRGSVPRWLPVLTSGIWLFMAQLLGYLAIAHLPLGIAIALFFVYPVVRLFLGWLMGTERQSLVRWLMGAVIIAGLIIVAPDTTPGPWSGNPLDPNLSPTLTGIIAGLGAGIAFAGYLQSSERSLKELHPVPLTMITFFVIFLFSGLGLIIQPGDWAAVQIAPNGISGLIIGAAVLGLLTLVSYTMNNNAVSKIGPSLVAVVGAFSPWLNGLLGWILLGETLDFRSNAGIALVTLGAIALSFNRFRDRAPQ